MNRNTLSSAPVQPVRWGPPPTAGHGDPQIKADENILRCVRFLDSIYFADKPCTFPRGALPEFTYVKSTATKIDPFEKK